MRDMEKTIANAKIPERYQLSCNEWVRLAVEAKAKEPKIDAALDAILKAFKYGFVLGQRCEKRGIRSESERIPHMWGNRRMNNRPPVDGTPIPEAGGGMEGEKHERKD